MKNRIIDGTIDSFDDVIPGLVSRDLERHRAASSSINSIETDADENDDSKQKAEDGKKEQNKQSLPLYKLFSFADPTDFFLMILGTVGALATGATMPLLTVFFGSMAQALGEHSNTDYMIHQVSKVCLDNVYLAIAATFTSFLQITCWMVTGERQAARIRKMYLNSLLNQEVAFFDNDINTGEVVGKMSGDTILIQEAIGEKAGMFIQQTSTIFTGYMVAFLGGWHLTLVMVSMIPLIVLCGAIMSKITLKIASHAQEANIEISAAIQQTVSSIRTVASFTGEKVSEEKVEKVLMNAYKYSIQEGVAAGFGSSIVKYVGAFAVALGFWYGTKLILDKSYTGGDILNILFAVVVGSNSVGEASSCIRAFAAGQAAAYKVFETIDRKPEINVSDETGQKPDVVHGNIEFKDVYFSYPSRPLEKIFTGLSISIHSGTSVALIGESGSGKSTVISLIERFYDPQHGEILIDGINIKQFNLRWLRQKIGLVSQEPVLFATTIRENIAYGKYDAANEEITAAARLANASKFINMLPQVVPNYWMKPPVHLMWSPKE